MAGDRLELLTERRRREIREAWELIGQAVRPILIDFGNRVRALMEQMFLVNRRSRRAFRSGRPKAGWHYAEDHWRRLRARRGDN